MGLPAIHLIEPPVLWRGHTVEVEIEVVVDHPIEVAGIEVETHGYDGWTAFGMELMSQAVHHHQIRSLVGRALLQADRHRFPIRIHIPRTMAPTHGHDPAYSHLELKVRIRRPRFWRADLMKRFWLRVREPPPFSIPRELATTRSEVTAQSGAYVELSLASTHLVIGERLLGSFAAFHLDDSRPQLVTLSLIPHLELAGIRNPDARVREGSGHPLRIEMPPGTAGIAQPFQYTLPPDLAPTFKADTHALSWKFSARVGPARALIPVVVYDASAASRTTPMVEVPAVADRRIAGLFTALEPAWRRVALEAPDERFAISRESAHGTLRLAYVYRGERGTFLVGRVRHRPLGLALSVTRSSFVQSILDGEVALDIAAWDRKYFVIARYADQARAMLRVAAPVLQELEATIAGWSDRALVLEQAIGGLEAAELARMTSVLAQAAEAIEHARDAITPPPALEVALERWRELARQLEGELSIGDLSIEGRLGALAVSLGLVFDDHEPPRATAVRATVGDRESAGAAAREIHLRSARPNQERRAPAAIASLLGAWPSDFADLTIEDGVVTAEHRLARGVAEAGRARDLVHALAAVRIALDPGAGPYR